MHCIIHTDGGSLNNPGKAAYGYTISIDGTVVAEKGEAIGIATNNVAEYTGLLRALQAVAGLAEKENITSVTVYADSQLMVRQLNGEYRIKNATLADLLIRIRNEEVGLKVPVKYIHVLREKNSRADALVKKALGR